MTILNTYQEVAGYFSKVSLWTVVFSLLALFFIFYIGPKVQDEYDAITNILLIGMAIFAGIISYAFGGGPIYKTRYEVTLDDTVSFVEIVEKYDIIEQRGDIYILQEKPQD